MDDRDEIAAQDAAAALIPLGWPVLPAGDDMEQRQIGIVVFSDAELPEFAVYAGIAAADGTVHEEVAMGRFVVVVAGLALTLTACGDSPEEISRKRDAACREWGAKPGSPEYIQCRAILEANAIRRRRSDDSDALALSAMATGLAAGSKK